MKRVIVTTRQLNEILTADYDMKNLKRVQRKIYNAVSDYCGKMHSDDAWQDVKTLVGMIKDVEGVEDIHVGSGEYSNYLNPEKGAHRDYETTVLTRFGKLYGYIRCHAAGTMDDIFKYYDMTISLYPDKKRDMEERLEEINEANISGTATKQTLNTDVLNGFNQNPGVQKMSFTLTDSPNATNTVTATRSEIEKNGSGIFNGIPNSDKVGQVVVSDDKTGSVSESRKYSKRQVELGRMLEMRKRGKVYSKKQLNEMFENGETDDIAEKLGQCPAFDVMTSFGCIFGREAEKKMLDIFSNSMSGAKDATKFIVSVYNGADPEDQQLFREKLGI